MNKHANDIKQRNKSPNSPPLAEEIDLLPVISAVLQR